MRNSMLNNLYLTIFLISATAFNSEAQQNQIRIIDSATYTMHLDSLQNTYGENKEIPAAFELPVLIALSYIPELKTAKIRFKQTKISSTMNARPTTFSLFFRIKSKRRYVIRINNADSDSLVLLKDAPFNAQIGVFGHEFNHLVDYSNRSFFGVLNRLYQYRKDETKEMYEKEIDEMTISVGLGWQLYDWSHHVIYQSKGKIEYVEFKKKIYLEPIEIDEIINDLGEEQ